MGRQRQRRRRGARLQHLAQPPVGRVPEVDHVACDLHGAMEDRTEPVLWGLAAFANLHRTAQQIARSPSTLTWYCQHRDRTRGRGALAGGRPRSAHDVLGVEGERRIPPPRALDHVAELAPEPQRRMLGLAQQRPALCPLSRIMHIVIHAQKCIVTRGSQNVLNPELPLEVHRPGARTAAACALSPAYMLLCTRVWSSPSRPAEC